MKTLLQAADAPTLKQAAQLIKSGQIVAFPTETVYGLGANATNEQAVAKIFSAKGRPADNPLIVHINSLEMAQQLAELTPLAQQLAAAFWPGPLSLVVAKRPVIPAIVSAGLDTVALRWPSHPVALALIEEAGLPIAAPSANASGRPSPTAASHVWEDLAGKIPLIVDGGGVEIGLESTVVDARGEYPVILRPGKISQQQLAELCGNCELATELNPSQPASPGMKYRHYAPQAPLYLATDAAEAYLISQRLPAGSLFIGSAEVGSALEDLGFAATQISALFAQDDLASYGKKIFSALRQADAVSAPAIIAQKVAEQGLGQAIMNRLNKAAAK